MQHSARNRRCRAQVWHNDQPECVPFLLAALGLAAGTSVTVAENGDIAAFRGSKVRFWERKIAQHRK